MLIKTWASNLREWWKLGAATEERAGGKVGLPHHGKCQDFLKNKLRFVQFPFTYWDHFHFCSKVKSTSLAHYWDFEHCNAAVCYRHQQRKPIQLLVTLGGHRGEAEERAFCWHLLINWRETQKRIICSPYSCANTSTSQTAFSVAGRWWIFVFWPRVWRADVYCPIWRSWRGTWLETRLERKPLPKEQVMPPIKLTIWEVTYAWSPSAARRLCEDPGPWPCSS